MSDGDSVPGKVCFGLQARFLLAMGLCLALLAAILVLLLQRQSSMQREVRALSGGIIHELFEHGLRSRGESIASALAEVVADPLRDSDLKEIEGLARNASRQRLVDYARLYDGHGRLVADGAGLAVAAPAPDPLALATLAAGRSQVRPLGGVLDVAVPVMASGRLIGSVRVGMSLTQAAQIEAEANERLRRRLETVGRRDLLWLLLLLAGLALVGVALAVYVQRTLVAPIRWLASAAQRIERGDYTVAPHQTSRRDEMGELLHAFGRMSRSIERHDREVRHMAYTDALTGLANRLALRQLLDLRLETALASGGQLALLFADVDDFKRVNDTLGHEAGDQVLLQFAARIGAAVNEMGGEDAVLARFGGDEFVILVQAEDAATVAALLAERLVQELRRPLQVQGREVFLGTSIGIALGPDDAIDATTLLKKGDIAMYQAKMAGKNCHRFYSRAMDHALERRVHMEQELRGAWERGELRLVYQPIHRLSDQRMVGLEVLLRWQHPTLGTIPPSTFIDVAENSGLIEEIGPKVLRAACMDAVQWPRRAGAPELFISVNVSSRQLRCGDLADMVARCLEESGLPPARLHLELTETAVIGDEMLAASLLDRLHRAGVKVWLDDFGTGFSGLSHLRQAPVDGVKIDKSFVADLQRDPADLALTTAIIAMAHSLGITVVAEGIELEAQFALLRERSCDLGQGYWFSQPLGHDDLLRLLES